MSKDFSITLEKKENFFYCSIPELKIVSKGENLVEVYAEIEKLKMDRIQSLNDYENQYGQACSSPRFSENTVKKIIIIMFFMILSLGITTHLIRAFTDNLSFANYFKPLKNMSEKEKEEKVKKFQVKIVSAQKFLKDAKPFIEVSKPLLRDIQESFELKNER